MTRLTCVADCHNSHFGRLYYLNRDQRIESNTNETVKSEGHISSLLVAQFSAVGSVFDSVNVVNPFLKKKKQNRGRGYKIRLETSER